MRYKSLLILFFILLSVSLSAQIYNPVSWGFGYEKKGDNLYELVFTATIDEGSHIYSMNIPEGGPIPTTIRFDTIEAFSLEGHPFEATTPEELFDEAFGFNIKSFSEKAELRQKIISLSPSFTVTGEVNFMACNNFTCSPPMDVEFEIKISDLSLIHISEPTRPY